ncbi:hypothetical protein GIB67_006582 [Kingdonia uniflora]|uniref:MADS-box domain-containing protein n=1 Tax=Kingdonia uniflora TaxID=39325 RepID=A0A7J7LET2_9MAGN|nr:hypothetical protein GIB67_006582 [Kingdonia uniflora]
MGRRKIEIEAITEKSKKQVTFFKHRKGLFLKTSELSNLCESDVAIITFSPGDKVFSFGNKPVDSVVARFLRDSQDYVTSTSSTYVCEDKLAQKNKEEMLDFSSIPTLLFRFTSTHVSRSYRCYWLCPIVIPS